MGRKVCVLTSAHPTFDVRIFHKECKSLARAGYDVELIAQSAENGIFNGVALNGLPMWKNRLDRMLRVTPIVFRGARNASADVYHFHDPELIPVALLLRLLGERVIYDIHEDLPRTISYKSYIPKPLKGSVSRVIEWIENWASRHFSGLVAATPTIAERFCDVNKNLIVLNNYPRMEELARCETGATTGRDPVFLYVGMLITRPRGAEEMVRAIGLLPPRRNAQLRFVGGWESEQLPAVLSELPGWKWTSYAGKLDRAGIAEELQKATAGLVILHPEPNYLMSQPVKLYEYMSAGLPVIASDFPVCREIIQETRCGLLVNPLDPQAIADAMEYLLAHPEEAAEMGRRGSEAVRDRYNWSKEEQKLLGFYKQLFRDGAAYRERFASRREAT